MKASDEKGKGMMIYVHSCQHVCFLPRGLHEIDIRIERSKCEGCAPDFWGLDKPCAQCAARAVPIKRKRGRPSKVVYSASYSGGSPLGRNDNC